MKTIFRILSWWREYRLERLRLQIEAKNKPYTTIEQVAKEFTAAMNAQTSILQDWIGGFKTTEIPKSSVVRELDEWNNEQKRKLDGDEWITVESPADLLRDSLAKEAKKAGVFPDVADILRMADERE